MCSPAPFVDHIVLPLQLYQRLTECIYMDPFFGSLFCPVDLFFYSLTSFDYCSFIVRLQVG